MSTVPAVKVLESITPANSGTGGESLEYAALHPNVKKYASTNAERSSKVWDSEDGSLEEESKARQLAYEYLLRTSVKLVESTDDNRDLWADRFIQATTELYGQPEVAVVNNLLTTELELLKSIKDLPNISQGDLTLLIDSYSSLLEGASGTTEVSAEVIDREKEEYALSQYGEAMREKYQPLFDLVDNYGIDKFEAKDLLKLLGDALEWLKENDDSVWDEWSAETKPGTALSVVAKDRRILVGDRRQPTSIDETRKLVAHEVLVHALRAKNGYKTGDKKLGSGLPGYLEVEEGLGILAEASLDGEVPDKAYDRYVDIALALGVVDGNQRSRREVFEISFARQLIRAQLKGEEVSTDELATKVWTHIDRIYRGGPGDDAGTKQAIFTKDIAYFVGYEQNLKFIVKALGEGKAGSEIFDYLTQGKFDPNNPAHLEHLEDALARKAAEAESTD